MGWFSEVYIEVSALFDNKLGVRLRMEGLVVSNFDVPEAMGPSGWRSLGFKGVRWFETSHGLQAMNTRKELFGIVSHVKLLEGNTFIATGVGRSNRHVCRDCHKIFDRSCARHLFKLKVKRPKRE